ncbi:hypothetical protein C2G38_2128486, partial [Gigaspora rosea]
MLNDNELAPLIPFKITFPSHPKPLFEYTNYISSISYSLHDSVKIWLIREGPKNLAVPANIDYAVESSLIAMILRTSKNLNSLIINETICNQLVLENLYENTTIVSISLCKIRDHYKPKVIDALVKIFYKNSTLISLELNKNEFGSKIILNLNSNQIFGIEGGKSLAKLLCKNISLISLDLGCNELGIEGGKVFAEALCKNSTLKYLDL